MVSTPESIVSAQNYCNTCQIDKDYYNLSFGNDCIFTSSIDDIQRIRNLRNYKEWKEKMIWIAMKEGNHNVH